MRVALFGDSLLRQVFLAAACGAWDSVVRSEVGWPRCRGASRGPLVIGGLRRAPARGGGRGALAIEKAAVTTTPPDGV